MSATTEPDGGDRLLLALTTEHFTLQAARSATISESAGRSALFIVMVSSGLIALAFTGQATQLGPPFWALALLLLPALLLLGTLTYLRLVQSAIDDLEFARGIERIHGYYRGLSASATAYFPAGGPVGGAPVPNAGGRGSHRHHLHSHSATMVLVVDGLLAGGVAAAVAGAAGFGVIPSALIGVAMSAAVAAAFSVHQARAWRTAMTATTAGARTALSSHQAAAADPMRLTAADVSDARRGPVPS
ncbi:MAG TPA: hypothetical protein PKD59_07655 [Miltoncostaeaceae bacterium]|nr:hypothetical protein [Miltoncostaeaceae bacterium]